MERRRKIHSHQSSSRSQLVNGARRIGNAVHGAITGGVQGGIAGASLAHQANNHLQNANVAHRNSPAAVAAGGLAGALYGGAQGAANGYNQQLPEDPGDFFARWDPDQMDFDFVGGDDIPDGFGNPLADAEPGTTSKGGGPGYTGNSMLPSHPLTQWYGQQSYRTYRKKYTARYRVGISDNTVFNEPNGFTNVYNYIPYEKFELCHNKESWNQDALNAFAWKPISAKVSFKDCMVDLILDPATAWPCQDQGAKMMFAKQGTILPRYTCVDKSEDIYQWWKACTVMQNGAPALSTLPTTSIGKGQHGDIFAPVKAGDDVWHLVEVNNPTFYEYQWHATDADLKYYRRTYDLLKPFRENGIYKVTGEAAGKKRDIFCLDRFDNAMGYTNTFRTQHTISKQGGNSFIDIPRINIDPYAHAIQRDMNTIESVKVYESRTDSTLFPDAFGIDRRFGSSSLEAPFHYAPTYTSSNPMPPVLFKPIPKMAI